MNTLNKAQLRHRLKKRGNAQLLGEKEAGYFRRTFELTREYDYDGLLTLSRSYPEIFKPFFSMLEERAMKILQSAKPAGSYLYFLLRKLFSGTEGLEEDKGFTGEVALEDKQIMELFLLLQSRPFGLKENRALLSRISEWNLIHLRDWVWQQGLARLLNERYRQQWKTQGAELPIQEILAKVKLPTLLNENELTDNYIFDCLSQSKDVTGTKTDQHLEKIFRIEAVELRKRLYQALETPELDSGYIRKTLEDLHMHREIEFIERHGVNQFNDHLDSRWSEGAAQVAQHHDFTFTPHAEEDSYDAIAKVNQSFRSQAHHSARGKTFLQREALLGSHRHCAEASCYLLPGNFVVVCLLQEEGLEHILFGRFSTKGEQEKFIGRCMSEFFNFENPRLTASIIIESYLKAMAGMLRLRKAIRHAIIAVPMMLAISVMLAWVYNFSMKNLGEGALLGLMVGLLGIGIAARNGFIQKIRPKDHDTIPEYLVLQRGVAKIAIQAELDLGTAEND